MTRPSELEHVVLALVWRAGPSTPYAIRRHFLASPTPGWSGSAGAIYPLVRRLEERGLLRSARLAADGRGTRRYALTPGGLRALEQWLEPPRGPALALGTDPLRTRLFFLGALGPARRARFLAAVERGLQAEVTRLRAALDVARREQGELGALAGQGALVLARARLGWWRTVRRSLTGQRLATDEER